MEARCPKKVKMPFIEPFDKTTDPDDHLDVYNAQMYIQDVDDATCCRYLLTTLKAIAQNWLDGLLDGSITSFLQLVEFFSAHFIASKRERKTSIHLAKIR